MVSSFSLILISQSLDYKQVVKVHWLKLYHLETLYAVVLDAILLFHVFVAFKSSLLHKH